MVPTIVLITLSAMALAFNAYAAYPKSELRECDHDREIIIGEGVVLALILSVRVGFLIESMVIAPLGGDPALASAAMTEISSGNLDVNIVKARRGSLLGNLSLMQEKLHSIVNAIHKAVERSGEQHDKFEQAVQAFQEAKSLSPERQSIAEEALLAAAGKVAKSDKTVSRAAAHDLHHDDAVMTVNRAVQRSMASVAMPRAVSKPEVMSVWATLLPMVLGRVRMLGPFAYRRSAFFWVPPLPRQTSASRLFSR